MLNLVMMPYSRESLGVLYDGFVKLLNHYKEVDGRGVNYVFKNLVPVLKRMNNENNYTYFDEIVDFIITISDDAVCSDVYMKAAYYPYEEVMNDFPQLVCAMHKGIKRYDYSKKYNCPLINLLIKYGEYAQERIQSGDDHFLMYPEYFLDCLRSTLISYLYRNNIEIDVIPLFRYIKENEQSLLDYYSLNGLFRLTKEDLLHNNNVLHHMIPELIEQYQNQNNQKQIF